MNNILIISGGSFKRERTEDYLKSKNFDFIIAADSGGEYAASLGLRPDLLIGDMDSVSKETIEALENAGSTVNEFEPEKDATDFDLALQKAASLKPEKITVVGLTGNRLDHTLTSFYCALKVFKEGIDCEIIDSNNRIYFKDNDFEIERSKQYGDFVSLVPVTESVTVSIKGMRYSLEERKVYSGESLCQSNEITDEKAVIKIKDGVVAVIESMD